jgi:hypothetical protein
MNKIKKPILIIFYNLFIFIFLILCFELILGDWFKNYNWGNSLRAERLKKISYSVKFNDNEYDFIYSKNSLGFRGEEVDPENLKILMIGGSTTNQRFTPEKYTIVGILNELLNKRYNDVKIYNGGVDGQSTVGHINNFSKWFPKIENFKPKMIIYYIGINDRYYFNKDPNPKNFATGVFQSKHAFDNMKKNSIVGQFTDYLKNNSFFLQRGKKFKIKYFEPRLRKENYSEFKAVYDLEHGYSENFYTQVDMDDKFDVNDLKIKYELFFNSFSKRLKYLTQLTEEIGAEPIFINQVLYDGQLSEKMYLTNYIIRNFSEQNDLKFIDLAKGINLDKFDFYDEFHTTPSGSRKIAEYIFPSLLKYIQLDKLIN